MHSMKVFKRFVNDAVIELEQKLECDFFEVAAERIQNIGREALTKSVIDCAYVLERYQSRIVKFVGPESYDATSSYRVNSVKFIGVIIPAAWFVCFCKRDLSKNNHEIS